MVENWLRIPILFSFEHVVVGLGANNLTQVHMEALMHEGGLTTNLIGKKLTTFGANGVSVFQGVKLGVIQQIFDGWVPHSTKVHCMVHETNLEVQTLSHLQMVNKIEKLLQTL